MSHYKIVRTYSTAIPVLSFLDPHHFDADSDADPDSTYHPNADPDSDFI